MTAEGQVKQGNMCLALSPGVVAMDCQEAAAVGAGQLFSGGRAKVRRSSCRWSAQPRQACASKRCKAEQALGHVKFAHAEACHLQDQSKFDGKRQASDFRSGILFQSCCGWHSGTGCSRQDWSAIWGGPPATFTVDRRVCQSLGCSSQGNKFMQLAAASELPLSGSAPLMFFEWRGNWTYLSFRSAGMKECEKVPSRHL